MDLQEKYASLVQELSQREDVYAVYLFGSYARGDAKKTSDLDVCFFIHPENTELFYELSSYKTDSFDIVIFHTLPLFLQFNILKEGVALCIQNEDAFREQKLKYLRKYREESGVLKRLMASRYGVEI